MNENYTIGWNTFEDHLKEASKRLYDKKYFADVTLVSEDLVQIQAHRFILSSSSPVFEKLLLMNQDSKALIYLKGIKHEEMKAITTFIYLGETKVQPERVDEFLKASADLEIKYFHNNSNGSNQKRLKKSTNEQKDEKLIEETEDPEVGTQNPESGFECEVCSKQFSSKDVMERHVKTIHQNEEQCLECTDCKKLFTRKDLLEKHELRAHRNKERFLCTSYADCNKQFTRKDALEKHVSAIHSENKESYNCLNSSCQKSFPRKDLLEIHEYKVHQELKCDECDIYFRGKNAHYKHVRKLHPQGLGHKKHLVNEENHVCANCMRSFSEKDELEKHIDVAHKVTCDICQIRLLRKNMNRHKLTHEDEDPTEGDEDYIIDDDF